MDPQRNPGIANPGISEPPAAPPQMLMPVPGQPETAITAGLEQAAAPVHAPMQASDVSWLPPTVPVPVPGQQSDDQAAAQTLVPVPDVAEDGDVIKKEWVIKAKKIVEQTRQDPYKQTKELHKFRAEYMQKRYNKVIEPVEE